MKKVFVTIGIKHILFASALFASISVSAQNYSDSTLSLQLSQRSAVYIGFYIKNNSAIWSNRTAPATLKNYINNGTNLDSLFTVSLKADYIKGLVDLLLSTSDEIVRVDRLSIINNSPAIPGYTSLASQIVTLAAGNGVYKQVAQYILNYYNERVAVFAALRTENISTVVTWSKN